MIKIVDKPLSKNEVNEFLGKPFEKMIKFVADIERGILALGGELHADAEDLLLKNGSRQENLWGGNFYPQGRRVEYTSLINIRPSQKNFTNEAKDPAVQSKMTALVDKLLP